MHGRLLPLIAVAAAVLGGCIVKPNEDFCCLSLESCQQAGWHKLETCDDPAKPFCDDAARTCIPDPLTTDCASTEDCMTPERPVCDVEDTGTCVRCRQGSDCDRFPGRPLCDLSGNGACVACLANSDCPVATAPVCGADKTCRGCREDSECATGVCNDSSGACVPENQIVYVNAATGTGGTCTRAQPCQTITQGIGAVDTTRRYVLVAPNSYVESLTVDSKTVTIVGTGASLEPAGSNQAALVVLSQSAVTIKGLRVHKALGSPNGDGIRCAPTAGTSSLTLRNVRVENNGSVGVEAIGCAVTIDRSTIVLNAGGGISLRDGSYEVRNSFIVRNGGLQSTYGGAELVGNAASSAFDFNTVAGNITGATIESLICTATSPQSFSNNIFFGSGADQISASAMCTFSYTLSNESVNGTGNVVGTPTFAGTTDFHLRAGSLGIDAADPAATLEIDIDGQARRHNGRSDIGADEVH